MPNLEKSRTTDRQRDSDKEEQLKEYYEEKEKNVHDELEKEDGKFIELINTNDFLKKYEEIINDVYDWYAAAMQRREREPLERDRFINHFFNEGSSDPTYIYGDYERGYLLGYAKYGVFVPTHFAPKNIRKGYELVKELGGSKNTPAVMAITEDLVKTITKMPEWKEFDMSFLASLGGEVTEKKIVYNKHPDVEKIMIGLLNDYLNEARNKYAVS